MSSSAPCQVSSSDILSLMGQWRAMVASPPEGGVKAQGAAGRARRSGMWKQLF